MKKRRVSTLSDEFSSPRVEEALISFGARSFVMLIKAATVLSAIYRGRVKGQPSEICILPSTSRFLFPSVLVRVNFYALLHRIHFTRTLVCGFYRFSPIPERSELLSILLLLLLPSFFYRFLTFNLALILCQAYSKSSNSELAEILRRPIRALTFPEESASGVSTNASSLRPRTLTVTRKPSLSRSVDLHSSS